MAPNAHFQSAELMAKYFQTVLTQHGLQNDARRLDGVEITTPEIATTLIEVVSKMKLANGHTRQPVLQSRDQLIAQLKLAASQSRFAA